MLVMAKKRPDRHKTKSFQLRIHPLLRDQLEKLVDRKLTTFTAEIVEAIRHHLENNQLWPPNVDEPRK